MEQKTFVKRVLMSLFGVMAGAVSVAVFKIAAFGVDPFQTFMAGLFYGNSIDRLGHEVIVNECEMPL